MSRPLGLNVGPEGRHELIPMRVHTTLDPAARRWTAQVPMITGPKSDVVLQPGEVFCVSQEKAGPASAHMPRPWLAKRVGQQDSALLKMYPRLDMKKLVGTSQRTSKPGSDERGQSSPT